MKLIEVDEKGHAVPSSKSTLPDHINKEICLYYYLGLYCVVVY